jgi:hypothetical protein
MMAGRSRSLADSNSRNEWRVPLINVAWTQTLIASALMLACMVAPCAAQCAKSYRVEIAASPLNAGAR